MSFEPEKFFIGVIDFFSILLPGGLLLFAGKGTLREIMSHPSLQLGGTESWMMFLFLAYLLGHIIFLTGSSLDELWDKFRKCGYLGQVDKLAAGKAVPGNLWRKQAEKAFGNDGALMLATRLRASAIARLTDGNPINTFQWCKARLTEEHKEALAEVQRFEADSKFFRSFVVVLVVLTITYLIRFDWGDALVCALLMLPTFWRYVDQRAKATNQAYFHVITLESVKTDEAVGPVRPKRRDGLTHAGGIVCRGSGLEKRYLLVQAERDREAWVLPKGHIEAGETPAQTAVREVEEEAGVWAKVVGCHHDLRFSVHDKPLVIRVFLMEFSGKSERKLGFGDRRHSWFSAKAIESLRLYPETKTMFQQSISPQSEAETKSSEPPQSA